MKNSEIFPIGLKNLDYKELRKSPATGIAAYPIPPFDVVQWTRNTNNNFGPNYLIDVKGNVYSVLPHEYHGNGDVEEKDRYNLIVFKADTPEADKAYENLITAIMPTLAQKPKTKTDNERSEVSSDRKSK